MFSPDTIPSGWLGSQRQLTNEMKSFACCYTSVFIILLLLLLLRFFSLLAAAVVFVLILVVVTVVVVAVLLLFLLVVVVSCYCSFSSCSSFSSPFSNPFFSQSVCCFPYPDNFTFYRSKISAVCWWLLSSQPVATGTRLITFLYQYSIVLDERRWFYLQPLELQLAIFWNCLNSLKRGLWYMNTGNLLSKLSFACN